MTGYPEVFGFGKRLFWLDRQEPEAGADPNRVMTAISSLWYLP